MDDLQETAKKFPSPAETQFTCLASSLLQLLDTARRELDHDRDAAKASVLAASSILQSEIDRYSGTIGSNAMAGGLAGWQVARVQAFIESNVHRTIRTEDLSAVARRSPAHFARSFKRAFGEPPHAYVIRRRLERACCLMTTSSASLSEIALSVGFSDQSHLCRLFKRAFGQSPSSWRRERDAPRQQAAAPSILRLLSRGSGVSKRRGRVNAVAEGLMPIGG